MYGYVAMGVVCGGLYYLKQQISKNIETLNHIHDFLKSQDLQSKLSQNKCLFLSCKFDYNLSTIGTFLNKCLGSTHILYPGVDSTLNTICLDRKFRSNREELKYSFQKELGGLKNSSFKTLVGKSKFDLNFMARAFNQAKFNTILLYHFELNSSETTELLGQLDSITNPKSNLFIITERSNPLSEIKKTNLQNNHFLPDKIYNIQNNPLQIEAFKKKFHAN